MDDKQDLNIRMTNLQKEFAGDKDALNDKINEKLKVIEKLEKKIKELQSDDSLTKM